MAVDQFLVEQFSARVTEIDADLAEMNAGLARAKANGDEHGARQLMQSYVNAKAERRNLEIEANEYIQANTPRAPQPKRELTWQELKAKPTELLDEDDAIRICGVTREQYYEGKRQAAAELASRKAAEQSR
jgi:hypothetical protein